MEKIINLIAKMKSEIIINLKTDVSEVRHKATRMVLKAYNTFQEEERDGVDYIFDIRNKEDFRHVVNGGMTAKEVFDIYYDYENNTTAYFYFGCNHPYHEMIPTYNELRKTLVCWLDDVLECVIAYPWVEGYRELYEEYVSNRVLCGVSLSDIDALAELKKKLEG